MIEAIAKIAEVAQEVAVSIEECKISVDVIEDMQSFLNDIKESTTEVDAVNDAEVVDAATETLDFESYQLDPHSKYFKDGHSFETDDRGQIYKRDGELLPNVEYISNGGKYRVDAEGNVETLEEGYKSSYKERYAQTPVSGVRGNWSGERAESRFIPSSETVNGAKAAAKLSEYSIDGIDYQDAIPNFDECAEESVQIDMTENRYSNVSEGIIGNFEKADTECARKWSVEGKDNRTYWTARDVADYRATHNMTWHECADRKTCQLLSRDIHEYFGHSGGVCECKRDMAQNIGGGFDA